jgi:ATP-dependent DNA ligase
MERLIPSRCTAKLPKDFSKEYLVAEKKLDGSRYVMYLGGDPYERYLSQNALLSRRASTTDGKFVDRCQQVPHICDVNYEGLEGTVLDGEVVDAETLGKNFTGVNSVLNSTPRRAIEAQERDGKLHYIIFDIAYFRGIDVRGRPLHERRKIMEKVVERMDNSHVSLIEQYQSDDIEAMFAGYVAENGEGLIIKDNRLGYGQGWAKMKKSYDVSCIITGYKPGNGKYTGQVGSLAISVWNEGKLLEVGFASGFNDALRKEMSDNFEKYKGMVVDIYTQELSKDLRLRHPTFYRLREDANEDEITLDKLKDDIKAGKTRSKRVRIR